MEFFHGFVLFLARLFTRKINIMKKRYIIALMAGILSGFWGYSQNQVRYFGCGTQPSEEYNDWFNSLDLNKYSNPNLRTEARIYLPVQFHLVGPATGAGRQNTTRALDLLCQLNTFYLPADIQFYMPNPVNVILNDNFYDLNDFNEGSTLMTQNNKTDVINVYITKLDNFSGAGFAICGYATFPGTGASGAGGSPRAQGGMILGLGSCTDVNGTTFPHEMGHYLSLYHPFESTYTNVLSSQAELVARPGATGKQYAPNCSTNGDKLCDTESDYLQGGWTSCNMTHTKVDRNNDVFHPDPTLYMSYSLDQCQTRFSPQQLAQMRSTALGQRSYLQNLYSSMAPVDTITTSCGLMEPADQASNVQGNWTHFICHSVPKANRYLLQISTNRTFPTNGLLAEVTLTDTEYLYTNLQMKTGTNYFWRVRPYRTSNTCGPLSSIRSFTCSTVRAFGAEEIVNAPMKVYPTILDAGSSVIAQLTQDVITAKFSVMNINGQTISSQVYKLLKNGQNIEIPIMVETPGMYLLNIETNQGRYTQKLMIK